MSMPKLSLGWAKLSLNWHKCELGSRIPSRWQLLECRERAEASVALQKAQLARLQSSLQLPPQQLPLDELELAPLWDAMTQLKAATAEGKEGEQFLCLK